MHVAMFRCDLDVKPVDTMPYVLKVSVNLKTRSMELHQILPEKILLIQLPCYLAL